MRKTIRLNKKICIKYLFSNPILPENKFLYLLLKSNYKVVQFVNITHLHPGWLNQITVLFQEKLHHRVADLGQILRLN